MGGLINIRGSLFPPLVGNTGTATVTGNNNNNNSIRRGRQGCPELRTLYDETANAAPVSAKTLRELSEMGRVICGITTRTPISTQDIHWGDSSPEDSPDGEPPVKRPKTESSTTTSSSSSCSSSTSATAANSGVAGSSSSSSSSTSTADSASGKPKDDNLRVEEVKIKLS